MSRGTDYKFVSTDSSETLASLITTYEKLTERAIQPADPDRVLIHYLSTIITQLRVMLNYAANQNLASRAEGENLDALGETIYNVARTPAKPAICTMQFTISAPQESAILVPRGTRITDSSQTLIWQTTEDALVPIGETTIEVPAQCETEGEVGNGYVPGQINMLIDIDRVMYFSSCENIDTSNSGAEQADDNRYYDLMRSGLDSYSTAGPKGAYEYWAKTVSSSIADVCAICPKYKKDGGYVHIFAIMDDGSIADDGTKNAIYEVCKDDKVRPLTDMVEVLDPIVVEYDISLTYYIKRGSELSVSDIEAAVDNAVKEYIKWQHAKIGRDINPSQLVWLLRETGIKRVEVTSPVFTSLVDGSDRNVPQIARVREINVVNGGYEDE
ncbi:MAG: baseplate J/gp47 family protein [Oscillospiraceae bacterium]|nr:baseplate J/gp47 family protein [Oscillospiraceae bacterium]